MPEDCEATTVSVHDGERSVGHQWAVGGALEMLDMEHCR
jgi:hypothetical protein